MDPSLHELVEGVLKFKAEMRDAHADHEARLLKLEATVRKLAGKRRMEQRLSKINRKVIEPPTDDYGRLLPLKQVQEVLNCSRQKIYKLYEAGDLQLVKFGGQTRVTEASLRAYWTTGLSPAAL